MSNPQSPPAEGSWQAVIDAVVPAVVALQVTAVRSFQDDHAGAHGGTGFVVDAEHGLMLTNRHVCTCGPERAAATFVGCPAMEEVPVSIAYVDPVHDFAFLRFDPTQLQQTPRAEIRLDPAGCRVGEEIRVVGNDSLEKLQILSGTVARIDRNPPDLSGDYHDENTFYALAGSGTRGGSSGSPVLNRHGRAVALNAAATGGTMHAFYLPLHRVARALEAVRRGEHFPRGTLCTAFAYASFPECLRLGVTKEFIQQSIIELEPPEGGTFSKASPPGGMLQVRRCIPGTAAATALQPGDVLLEVAGRPCADFVLLDEAFDARVGKSVPIALCRGGQRVELELDVQDLHSLIPHSFIELGLGVFHEVPYQTAQKHNIPLEGIYVAQAGFVFGEAVKTDAVILELNGSPCADLRAFEEALREVPNRECFHVTWMVPKCAKERRKCEGSVKMARHWFTSRAWSLDINSRVWTPRLLQGPDEEAPCDEPSAELSSGTEAGSPRKKARRSPQVNACAALEKTICSVEFRTVQNFDLDIVMDGENVEGDNIVCRGAGIIVDPKAGFVLTDRVTVPQPLGDIEVTLGEECRSASVWFVHPLHNLVVLRLDASSEHCGKPFGEAAVFEDHVLEAGDECDFVGVDAHGNRLGSQVRVQDVRMGNFPSHWPPRWHERNLEAVILAETPEKVNSGVLCDARGRIHAVYTTATLIEAEQAHRLGYGLPAHVLLPIVEHLRGPDGRKEVPSVPSLEIEVKKAELAKLRRLPLRLRPPAEWLSKLGAAGGMALKIAGATSRGPCDGIVVEGDLLVAVNDQVVTSAKEIEAKLQEVAHSSGVKVRLTLLRKNKKVEVSVAVPLLGTDGAKRLLCWHGLVLQEIPRSIREAGAVPVGVHIAQTMLGSPGEANGIEGEFLMAVDGTPTPNLDALIAIKASGVASPGKRCHLRVETADTSGRRFVKSLEPDPLFWPTMEMSQNVHGTWSCVDHSG